MKRLFLLLVLGFFFQAVSAQTPTTDEGVIRAILANQTAQWNRGNIDGYMVGYWQSDSLVFIGKSGPTYGYNATLARYKKAYPDAARMGQLTSTILSVRSLSPEWAYVTGSWALKRVAGDVSGYYTLLLRKIAGEWVIVEDHSS